MPTIMVPYYEKLPETLYGSAFSLEKKNPDASVKETDLYFFHDRTWATDAKHILGWSRELLHSLTKLKKEQWPDWLLGHAFHRQDDGSYKLSGSDEKFGTEQLIGFANDAAAALEAADVQTDQWGAKSYNEWHDNLSKHLPNDPVHQLALKSVSPLELFTVRNNASNTIYHPEYPTVQTSSKE